MKSTALAKRTLFGAAAVGLIAAGTVAQATVATAEVAPADAVPVFVQTPTAPLLHGLPAPLACLATTGSALWCIGIT